MHLSYTEENYLKAIYKLAEQALQPVSTNAIAVTLHTSPAAVTDMAQKLHQKELVTYQKYQGIGLSALGKGHAIKVIRKHRLWEVFLVEKLKFGWDEVHEAAEQLEHIQSALLIQRLDDFLGNPVYSPHGDPIPNAQGEITAKTRMVLTNMEVGSHSIVVAVKEDTPQFLQYLSKRGIYLGAQINVLDKILFDQSMDISIDKHPKITISQKVSDHILVVS